MLNTVEYLTEKTQIEKEIVALEQRIQFFPSFGVCYNCGFITLEGFIYAFAQRHLVNYDGGHWTFVNLSNGGKYLYLTSSEEVTLTNTLNYFSEKMSSELAGILICSLVYAQCSEYAYVQGRKDVSKSFQEHFDALKIYVLTLDEKSRNMYFEFLD